MYLLAPSLPFNTSDQAVCIRNASQHKSCDCFSLLVCMLPMLICLSSRMPLTGPPFSLSLPSLCMIATASSHFLSLPKRRSAVSVDNDSLWLCAVSETAFQVKWICLHVSGSVLASASHFPAYQRLLSCVRKTPVICRLTQQAILCMITSSC